MHGEWPAFVRNGALCRPKMRVADTVTVEPLSADTFPAIREKNSLIAETRCSKLPKATLRTEARLQYGRERNQRDLVRRDELAAWMVLAVVRIMIRHLIDTGADRRSTGALA